MLKKIWKWYYNHFINDDRTHPPKLSELRWLPKTIIPNKNEKFGYIDTIYFDIEKIPIKTEIILDIQEEVNETCAVQL